MGKVQNKARKAQFSGLNHISINFPSKNSNLCTNQDDLTPGLFCECIMESFFDVSTGKALPCSTQQTRWRQQKSRGCTVLLRHSSHASTCCTPDPCHTTTPCCPLRLWRTTAHVRTGCRHGHGSRPFSA